MTNDSDDLNVERLRELLTISKGDKLINDLVAIFEGYRPQIASMEMAIGTKDFSTCRFVAHKMKAAAANLGADRLAAQSDFFENIADTISAEEFTKKYHQFVEEFEAVMIKLQEVLNKIRNGVEI